MMQETESQKTALRRYLLGSAPEDERESVEQALLADENLYEELLVIEDELIDQYVWGQLPEPGRTSFLQYLDALPDHKERLEFAQALRAHSLGSRAEASVATAGSRGTPEEGFGFRVPALFLAAAVLLIMLGGVWSLATISALRNEVRTNQTELERSREGVAESRLSSDPVGRGAPGTGSIPSRSFLLRAGTFRSGGTTQVLPMPQEPALVEIRLDLGVADYESYRAVFHDAQSAELMSVSQLGARVQENEILVAFSVSSERFTAGDYYISLSGVVERGELEPVARYDFRISRE
ncbi:MAG TPA: hypothetical protein VJB88_10160 [Vicinamibacteria bacterium]|nr:hypothetical protein [Vicinamibacteria bacterium]